MKVFVNEDHHDEYIELLFCIKDIDDFLNAAWFIDLEFIGSY